MNNKISNPSKILLWLSAILLLISIFVPLWRIELSAPQYPEGLVMKIFTNKLGGDVEIINGLNHYIGMETLHAENFIEFTILPFIIGFYSLLMILTAIAGRKKWLYLTFSLFVLFGIIAMIDFWRWEYNYGHHLNPNAAIIVPGMAYQPPLIGYKQLLNFGAYSIPDIGGWLFIIVGLLLLISIIIEAKLADKFLQRKTKAITIAWILLYGMVSCNSGSPVAIQLNKDKCDFCSMTIADGRFGGEVITTKGRAYKFDDIVCMQNYIHENTKPGFQAFYIHDYAQNNLLIDATTAYYFTHNELRSPMGGNIAAFANQETATQYAQKINAVVVKWDALNSN